MSRSLREKNEALLAAERGTVRKPGGAELSVALAYPNTYHVGMSNLGVHRIYSLLNARNDTVCERVFLPDEDDLEEYARSGTKLFALESGRPVRDFDILAFSVSFEQDYLHVLEMLRLAGIPADKRERSGDDPLVLLGGICSFFNPEPLADFFDAVIVGEGEKAAGEFLDAYLRHREQPRQDLLLGLSGVPGVYIPEFYAVSYREDGTIGERTALVAGVPDRVTKRTEPDISESSAATAILTPNTEFGDMHLLEMTRGCGRHCRFCMAGYIYLPPRHLSAAAATARAEEAAGRCRMVGLVGAALSDYPDIGALCDAVPGKLSVSSLRADSVGESLVRRLAASGHKTVSIAPEAGSERLRRVINKNVTDGDILRAADLVFGSGIPNLKLYFIIGLPTETQEDVQAIAGLALRVRDVQLRHARTAGRIGRITLSVNSFVPKPFTPFQWEPMEAVAVLKKKMRFLAKTVQGIGNMNMIHDLPKWEYLQALLSRGDRRIGRLLRAALENGGDWRAAANEAGLETDFFVTRARAADEALPWDFIDIGVRKDYLSKERERAFAEKQTPPCMVGSCRSCGACG